MKILYRPDIDNALKLWALDYLSDNVLSILDDPSEPGILAAKLLQRYSALIKEIISHKAPWKLPWICALFQIKEDGAHIRITPATFLNDAFGTTKSSQSADTSGALLSRNEFGNILRRHLEERLRTRIMVDCISSCPCVQFASHESCHEGSSDTHKPWNTRFNQRVRFHLLRIMILDEFYSISQVDKFSSRISNQRCGPSLPLFRSSREINTHVSLPRRLLQALDGALKPPGPLTGSKYALKGDLIPEAVEGFSTAKRWALGALTALGRPKSELQLEFADVSYMAAMKELKNGWERTANLESIRSAVSRATHLLGLLVDPPRLAWDGLTLYRLRDEGPDFSCAYFYY